MAHLHKSAATLRIGGDDLDPDEISKLLGGRPTMAYRKGDVLPIGNSGQTRTTKTGMWSVEVADRNPENLDGQIAELLGGLTQSLDVWRQLASRFNMDIFCGFFMHATNEGLEVSVESLAALSSRGISLGMCIYAPIQESPGERSDA